MIHEDTCLYCGERCDGRHYARLDPVLRGEILAALQESDDARIVALQAQVRAGLTNSTPVTPWGPSPVSAAASTAALDTFRARVDAADNVRLGGTPRLPYRIAIPHVEHGSMSFAADVFGFSQGRECGGILIGREDPDGVTVLATTDDARGERNSARLEFEPAERRARELDCQVVGTWHTHNDAESTRPSPTDMRSLANMLLIHGLERCAGLVLTPHPTTGRPVFNPYIARGDGARTIVEPAVIEVE